MAMQSPVNKMPYAEDRIIEFQGWNRKLNKDVGEMYDMQNLTADMYPSLSQRKGIKRHEEYDTPFFRGGEAISRNGDLYTTGFVTASEFGFAKNGTIVEGFEDITKDSKMVSINNKICFIDDGTYYDVKSGEKGNLVWSFEGESSGLGIIDGYVLFSSFYCSVNQSKNRVYIYATKRLTDKEATFIGWENKLYNMVNVDDVINLEGFVKIGDDYHIYENEDRIISRVVYKGNFYSSVAEDYVDAIGISLSDFGFSTDELLDASGKKINSFIICKAQTMKEPRQSIDAKVYKSMPELDYVIEWNNRLWGCSNKTNTIYATKLGDPTNWEYYQSTAADSYYAEQGSDGDFTGVGKYSNHLLFFKENCIHKVYGTSPASYQVITIEAPGVKEGCSKSVCSVNDMIFYYSNIGFMAYQGERPECVSKKFVDVKYNRIRSSGTDGFKYFVVAGGKSIDMLVCDTDNAMWHKYELNRETSGIRLPTWIIKHQGKMIFNDGREVYEIEADESDESIKWFAEFGPFDEYIENKKITNRLDMRIKPEEESILQVYIQLDESGDWELVDTISDQNGLINHSVFIPRRCNRFSIRLEGEGRCRIDSIRRQYREGSGGGL